MEGVEAVEQVGRNDVRGNRGGQSWLTVAGRRDDSVVEVVVSQGFDGRLVEDHSGEACVVDSHGAGG